MGDSYVLHLEKKLDETSAERDRLRERVAELEQVHKDVRDRLRDGVADLERENARLRASMDALTALRDEILEQVLSENAQLRADSQRLEHNERFLRRELDGIDRLRPLCPDHRDKQQGSRCLACRIEELEKAPADSERLEWLERHVIPGVTAIDDSGEEYNFDWGPSLPCSLREAIDSARHREPQAQDGEAKE